MRIETLLDTGRAWDGTPYQRFPLGEPRLIVLRISMPPHTTLQWHMHPVPSAGFVLSGEIFVEKPDGQTVKFVAGQAAAETVDVTHRGRTEDHAAELLVFYVGIQNVPISIDQPQ